MKYIYSLSIVWLLYSCDKNDAITCENIDNLPKYPEVEVAINNHNYVNNMALDQIYAELEVSTKAVITSDSIWNHDFGKTVRVQSDESIIMPNLQRYIYPGSILKGNSIVNMNYQPITTAQIKPITVSVSFPATNISATIEHPSLSETRQFINKVVRQNGVGEQNASLEYDINRFTSYHELKVAFGSNIDTGALFWKKTSSSSSKECNINKSTGLYVKFIQRNYTLDMDLPVGSIIQGSLPSTETGGYSPVYVSSVTYGRIGIFTIETNETSDYASQIIKEAFRKIFVNKTSTLNSAEKRVLNNADMKVYLIGGSGETSVQTIKGFEGFIEHISSGGTFSAENPGVPIYCSYSYLSDNSPVKTNFKFNLTTDPIYARLNFKNSHKVKDSDNKQEEAYDVYLEFFNNPTGTSPTVPPAFIKFYLCKQELDSYEEITYDITKQNWVNKTSSEDMYLQNFYNATSILVQKDLIPYKIISQWFATRCDDDDSNCVYSKKEEIRLRINTFTSQRNFYQTIPPKQVYDFYRGRMDSRRLTNGYWRSY